MGGVIARAFAVKKRNFPQENKNFRGSLKKKPWQTSAMPRVVGAQAQTDYGVNLGVVPKVVCSTIFWSTKSLTMQIEKRE